MSVSPKNKTTLGYQFESSIHLAGAIWGVVGVIIILGLAVTRIGHLAVANRNWNLSLIQVGFLVVWLFFMLFSEGYRAFQKEFAPRVVARAQHLAISGKSYQLILAPLFCMGFFGAKRRRIISAWAVSLGIVGLVLLVRLIPQPWRAIIDLGVIAGLSYGVGALLYFGLKARQAHPKLIVDPELK